MHRPALPQLTGQRLAQGWTGTSHTLSLPSAQPHVPYGASSTAHFKGYIPGSYQRSSRTSLPLGPSASPALPRDGQGVATAHGSTLFS